MDRFLGDSPGAIALLILGVALVACGADVCWCRFKRPKGPDSCASGPRRL